MPQPFHFPKSLWRLLPHWPGLSSVTIELLLKTLHQGLKLLRSCWEAPVAVSDCRDSAFLLLIMSLILLEIVVRSLPATFLLRLITHADMQHTICTHIVVPPYHVLRLLLIRLHLVKKTSNLGEIVQRKAMAFRFYALSNLTDIKTPSPESLCTNIRELAVAHHNSQPPLSTALRISQCFFPH